MWGCRLRGHGTLKILAAAYLTKIVNNSLEISSRGENMKNPLDSLWGTVIAGVVLTVVLFVFARNFLG